MPMHKKVNPTPQQRWQSFQNQYIPTLSSRQKWGLTIASIALIILFVVAVLPFILPLTGPDPISKAQVQDENGAYANLNGVEIYYQHLAADGDTVLLIHGQAGSTLTWETTMPALQSAGYNVYAIDLPGYGLSEKGLGIDFSHPFAADLLIAFMDTVQVQRAHIIAHAYGGNIAALITQKYPERVISLVLSAPTLITWSPPQVPASLLELFFIERWIRVSVRLVGPAAVGEQLRSATKVDDVVDQQLIDDYSRLMKTEDWDFTAIGVARDSHLNQLPLPLANIQQPTLLVWGTDDGWAPPDAATGILAEIPNSTLIEIPDIGHLPMHESPTEFNSILINFLDNIE